MYNFFLEVWWQDPPCEPLQAKVEKTANWPFVKKMQVSASWPLAFGPPNFSKDLIDQACQMPNLR